MTRRELVRDGGADQLPDRGQLRTDVLSLPAFQIIDSRMWDGEMSEPASVGRVVSYHAPAMVTRERSVS